jgi:two-component system, OmpR family, phosphate regulon response regulator PhoB
LASFDEISAWIVTEDLLARHRFVTPERDTDRVNRSDDVRRTASGRQRDRVAFAGFPAPGSRVLVVEDEPDVAELIRYNLAKEGYAVTVVHTGAEALRLGRDNPPDVILLDVMIPELNGWEVCRSLRRDADTADIPIIMVTGRTEEGDKVLGFEMGADDYVTKPFSPRELIARILAVARRRPPTSHENHLKAGDLEIDRERFEVKAAGRPVPLTPKEFELLATLAAAPGRVFRREEILDRVWGRDGFIEPRTVDVHFARLRRKFLTAGASPPAVETVRGVGYRLREP